jgi:hypothetical protein
METRRAAGGQGAPQGPALGGICVRAHQHGEWGEDVYPAVPAAAVLTRMGSTSMASSCSTSAR